MLNYIELFLNLLKHRMINGDDRYRATVLSADEIERYDGEIGYTAQKSKQEELLPDQSLDDIAVTYLKTAQMYIDGNLVRVDSIVKLILSRYNRERTRFKPAPHSLVLETLMAATRHVEHPDLHILVDWLYNSTQVGKLWVTGRLTTQQLISGSVAEQMQVLLVTKGKKWLRRKGVDADYVINKMAQQYGLVQGGHRQSDDYLDVDNEGRKVLNFEKLPVISRIQAIAAGMTDFPTFKGIRNEETDSMDKVTGTSFVVTQVAE